MSVDGSVLLEHSTFAITFALVVVLGLRPMLRRRFGAAHAYALWLLVPLMPCVCLLPDWMPKVAITIRALKLEPVIATASHWPSIAQAAGNALPIMTIWLSGAVCLGLFQCWLQWRFVYGLGKLERVGTVYHAQSNDIGPALVGLLRARIVVPYDFASRYTPVEQDLILAHECAHVRRGDVIANAVCALLQTMFWFHPLMHIGAIRFRADQELACDASVMQLHGESRKIYAQAMLKTHTQDFALPAGCGWQSKHLLKERIMQLNRQFPSPAARQIGSALVSVTICLAAGGVLAVQTMQTPDAGAKPSFDVLLTTKLGDGGAHNLKVKTSDGEQFVIKEGESGDVWEESFVLHASANNSFMMDSTIKHQGETIGHPTVLFKSGQPATVKIGGEQSKYELVVDAHVVDVKDGAKSGS